jgi:hypothetical protein
MDREAIARRRRRQQALEQLESEREREAALRDQLEEVIADQLATQVDEAAFARMPPEDVDVVRQGLGAGGDAGWEGDPDETDEAWEEPGDDAGDDEGVEEEIERLEAEIDASHRRQQAYERYIEALEA